MALQWKQRDENIAMTTLQWKHLDGNALHETQRQHCENTTLETQSNTAMKTLADISW